MNFLHSLLHITAEMSPYLLLGFFVAGVLHVFVPSDFYRNYLTGKGLKPVLIATLLGIPLPLCSCGVIPTAVGLRNEKASAGAVGAFLIATPQTGVDSIVATYSLMGLTFALFRPLAALVTGIVGGMLIGFYCSDAKKSQTMADSCEIPAKSSNRFVAILRYAFVDMVRNIGARLVAGLIIAAVIQVAVPDSFFLQFNDLPFLQMLVMLVVAVPMYVCSTGSIPIAAALLAKGLTPGAALVLLMAGPAVNFGSILVISKTMGRKFCSLYIAVIVLGALFFGTILNNTDFLFSFSDEAMQRVNGTNMTHHTSPVGIVCGILLTLMLLNVFIMSMFNLFKKEKTESSETLYRVEGMKCNHCKASVEKALLKLKGVESAEANLEQKTVKVKGTVSADAVRKAVEEAGFEFI